MEMIEDIPAIGPVTASGAPARHARAASIDALTRRGGRHGRCRRWRGRGHDSRRCASTPRSSSRGLVRSGSVALAIERRTLGRARPDSVMDSKLDEAAGRAPRRSSMWPTRPASPSARCRATSTASRCASANRDQIEEAIRQARLSPQRAGRGDEVRADQHGRLPGAAADRIPRARARASEPCCCASKGRALLTYCHNDDSASVLDLLDFFDSHRVDCLVMDGRPEAVDRVREFVRSGTPVIFYDNDVPGPTGRSRLRREPRRELPRRLPSARYRPHRDRRSSRRRAQLGRPRALRGISAGACTIAASRSTRTMSSTRTGAKTRPMAAC